MLHISQKMLAEDEKVEVFVTCMEQDGNSVLLWAQIGLFFNV